MKLRDEIITYIKQNNFVIHNIINDEEFVLNKTAEIIFTNIELDDYKILNEIETTFDDVPKNSIEIIQNFKKDLIGRFFYD
ncbi:hypothetical protein [Parvimonas parva]|uniref:Uncharacterized protein n=1 Tax=Parvimonas parva TaxID=2769485 RepID=A0ABS1C735_9FIRM|nr:hypothetical protein [Parvimonas parva]MBK1467908.1 hypothetical protein [Parvimonas parva]